MGSIAAAIALVTFALSFASLQTLLGRGKTLRVVTLGLGGLIVGWAFFVLALLPDDRIASLVTMLHEGREERTLRAFFGQDGHVGPLWRVLAASLARPGHVPIVDLLRFNLLLAGISGGGLAVVAALATGRLWAAVLTFALFVTSRGVSNSALSETPASLLWCLALASAPAWALLDQAAKRPLAHRLLALATVTLCTLQAAVVREECALLGVPFIVLGIAAALGRPLLFDRALDRARRWLFSLAVAPWPVRLGVLALIASVPAVSSSLGLRPRLLLHAVVPLTADLVHIPTALLAVAPFPVVILAVIGAVAALQGRACRVALVLAATSLHALYLAASHGVGWEMFRYAAHSLAVVWLLAVLGWKAVEHHAARAAWPSPWRWWIAGFALLVSVGGWFDPSSPGWWDDDARVRAHASDGSSGMFLNQSKQHAARLLLRHVRQAPRCAFVARVRALGLRQGRPVLAVFGVDYGLSFADADLDPRQVALATGAPCLRYYWSLDCNMQAGPSCAADVNGARLIEVWQGRHATYSDSEEYGALTPEVGFGVWSLDEAQPPSAP